MVRRSDELPNRSAGTDDRRDKATELWIKLINMNSPDADSQSLSLCWIKLSWESIGKLGELKEVQGDILTIGRLAFKDQTTFKSNINGALFKRVPEPEKTMWKFYAVKNIFKRTKKKRKQTTSRHQRSGRKR